MAENAQTGLTSGLTNALTQGKSTTPAEEDYSWLEEGLDFAGSLPDDTGEFERAVQTPPKPAPVASPDAASVLLAKRRESLLRELLSDPEAFLQSRIPQTNSQEVEQLKQMVMRSNMALHQEKVDLAKERAISRLKDATKGDPALQSEPVRKAVKEAYVGLVQQAMRGDQMALNTLNNPLTARLAIEAAKLQTRYGSTQESAPVSYGGAPAPVGSTASPSPAPVQLSESDNYFIERWNIKPEVAAENVRLATPRR